MEDIYNNSHDIYILTDEEKFKILDSIQNEFDMEYKYDSYKYDMKQTKISFEYFGVKRSNTWESLWGCIPPLSNVRYIVREFGKDFDGSKTDMLCRTIHENKIQQIYLENLERKKQKC